MRVRIWRPRARRAHQQLCPHPCTRTGGEREGRELRGGEDVELHLAREPQGVRKLRSRRAMSLVWRAPVRRAGSYVEPLPLHVSAIAGTLGIRVRAVALRHSTQAHGEGDVQEHRHVPPWAQFVTMQEHPLHDHDRIGRHGRRAVIESRVSPVVERSEDNLSFPSRTQGRQHLRSERVEIVGVFEEALGGGPPQAITDHPGVQEVVQMDNLHLSARSAIRVGEHLRERRLPAPVCSSAPGSPCTAARQ